MTKLKQFTAHFLSLLIFLMSLTHVNAQTAPSALSETYQNWAVRCATTNIANKPARICEMNQILRQRDTGKTLLTISLRTESTGAALTMIAPFGLKLSEGLRLEITDKPVLKMAFRTCLPAGCVAVNEIPIELINKMAAAADATIVMVGSANNQEIKVTVSLAGFTAAWNRLVSFSKS